MPFISPEQPPSKNFLKRSWDEIEDSQDEQITPRPPLKELPQNEVAINTTKQEPYYKNEIYYGYFLNSTKWNLLNFLKHLENMGALTNRHHDHRLYRTLLQQIDFDPEQSEVWQQRAKFCNSEEVFKKQITRAVDNFWNRIEAEQNSITQFEQEVEEFSKLRESTQDEFLGNFECAVKESQQEIGNKRKFNNLLKRRILLINSNSDINFITSEHINEEFLIGIPTIQDIPLIQTLLSKLNEMIFTKKYCYNYHSTGLFGARYSEPRTEADIQALYVIPLLKVIRRFNIQLTIGEHKSKAVEYRQSINSSESWPKAIKMDASGEIDGFEIFSHENASFHKDLTKKTRVDLEKLSVYMRDDPFIYWKDKYDELRSQFVEIKDHMTSLRSWGMLTMGPRAGRSGLHCEIYAMRQISPGYFTWVLVDWFLFPHKNMDPSFQPFSKCIEVMLRLAFGLKETQRMMHELDNHCTKIRLGKKIAYI
ncbi:23023_t:CDS:2 [Racocetra persica]|uniref:23023_t:CDS:1 n=1 Tax=Racocetra persica TaxID=160502 RepID=A0ACA9KZ34_9GLOM|nr:23023_t:CDS:2 [Racocetra persica]